MSHDGAVESDRKPSETAHGQAKFGRGPSFRRIACTRCHLSWKHTRTCKVNRPALRFKFRDAFARIRTVSICTYIHTYIRPLAPHNPI